MLTITEETTRDYDSEMRRLLAQLELLSHGRCANWNRSGGGSGDHVPVIDLRPGRSIVDAPHLWLRERYARAETPKQKERCIELASEELRRWRGGSSNGVQRSALSDAEILRDRILTEGRGQPAQVVAQALRCTATHVRKVRLAAGVDDQGASVSLVFDEEEELRRRVLQFVGRNLSQRQIALLAGCSARTVGRVLKDAA